MRRHPFHRPVGRLESDPHIRGPQIRSPHTPPFFLVFRQLPVVRIRHRGIVSQRAHVTMGRFMSRHIQKETVDPTVFLGRRHCSSSKR